MQLYRGYQVGVIIERFLAFHSMDLGSNPTGTRVIMYIGVDIICNNCLFFLPHLKCNISSSSSIHKFLKTHELQH